MKKKLLLGAVVVAGLTMGLTSCVDNVESASVTNIRNAKTEQLKSLAALNNANAQAALILANAEAAAQAANQAYLEAQAALLAAQADYEAAQAELIRAQAALLDAQTEAERAKLEYELKLLQAELDKKAQELADAQAEAAAKLALLEKELAALDLALQKSELELKTAQFYYDQMLKNAQALDDLKDQIAAAQAAARLKQLISEYDTASKNLITAQRTLAKDKMALIQAEAGLEDSKTLLNNQIKDAKDQIVEWQLNIAEQEGIIDLYSKYAGKEVTKEDMYAAHVAYFDAQEVANDAQTASSDAWSKYWEAYYAMYSSEYQKLFYDIAYASYGEYFEFNDNLQRKDKFEYEIQQINEWNWSPNMPADCKGKWCLVINKYKWYDYNWNPDESYDPENGTWSWYEAERVAIIPVAELEVGENVDVTVEDLTSSYNKVLSLNNLVNDGAGLKAWLECRLKGLEGQAPAYTVEEWKEMLKEAEDAIAGLVEARDDAVEAHEAAIVTAKQKKDAYEAYNGDDGIIQSKYDAYEEAFNKYDWDNYTEESYQKEVGTLWQAYIDSLDDANDAYAEWQNAEQEKRNKFYGVTKAQADLEQGEWEVVYAQNNLNEAEYGTADYESAIAEIKEKVDNCIAESANNTANIEAYNTACEERVTKDLEYQIANTKAGIANTAYWDLYYAVNFYGGILGGIPDANQAITNAKNLIKTYETWIKGNENSIASYEKTLANIEAGMDVRVEAIEDLKATIAKDEVNVSTCQTLFDIAKAALEAELNK